MENFRRIVVCTLRVFTLKKQKAPCVPMKRWYYFIGMQLRKDVIEDHSMNTSIIYKPTVNNSVLDTLAKELPAIIAGALEVPGGRLAMLTPEQISLAFSQANPRDVGSDIRIMAFARSNDPRASTENELAKSILKKVMELVDKSGEKYSVNIRLYLMEIGVAEYSLSS